MRFRLRFLLQEIDLHQGETAIGRSADCHVTIEDPLVSRHHARIRIADEIARIEDLDSRNGTFVNGKAVDGEVVLNDGDRVRIGTLELVFCHAQERVAVARQGHRTTGFMCHCASCGSPYPAESRQCPHCGSDCRVDEDTVSGVISEEDRNWTLDFLIDVLDRAVTLERWNDVNRILVRARANIDSRIASAHPIERKHIDQVAEAAVRLAAHRGEPEWATWVLAIHEALGRLPAEAALQPLDLMPAETRSELAAPAARLLETVGDVHDSGNPASLTRLRALRERS